MKLCFFGSGIEKEDVFLSGVEVEPIVDVVRQRFDTLLYGGTNVGLMGDFAKSFLQKGGRVCSVVPRRLWEHHPDLVYQADEVIRCESLADRKKILFDGCDAIVSYPGGIGTFDEICSFMAECAVGERSKEVPLFLYNIDQYFAPFLLQLETARECGLLKTGVLERVHTFTTSTTLTTILDTTYGTSQDARSGA